MNSTPLVSLIIAVYNGAPFIRDAVQSVLNQTLKDFEIIVVDDGSTDDIKKVLGPWIQSGQIQYIYQQNKGLAGARNTGLRHAKGRYVKFFDCDDLLYPEQLERQVEQLKDQPPDILSCSGYALEFESGKKIELPVFLANDQLAQFIGGNPCPVHTVLVERSVVEKAGCFDESLFSHEDSDLWLRILRQGGVFKKIDYVGCCYRIRGGALSDDTRRMFQNFCRFSEKLNQTFWPELKNLPKETLRSLYFRNMNLLHQALAQNLSLKACLPKTLQTIGKIHAMKLKGLGAFLFSLTGPEKMVREKYARSCAVDPAYAEKLLNIPWRDERFYERGNPDSGTIEPMNKIVKNILYINSSAVIYGAETRLMDIIKYLDRSKYRPFVLLPHMGPFDARLKELGVITMQLEFSFPLNKGNLNRKNLSMWWKLNMDFIRLLRQHDIDLIHINLHINVSKLWLGFLLSGKPIIMHMRSHFWVGIFERFVICRMFKTIFISKFVRREFTRPRSTKLMLGRECQTDIIYDGIDINHFTVKEKNGKLRRELNIQDTDFMVGIIGAVDKIKGQDLLIQAARIVVAKHPHAKFVVVGDLYHHGKNNLLYRVQLHNMIKEYQLENNFIFTGFRSDVDAFMNEVDLLVQPSEREALGTSMVEAMACGKPVIGTKVDGIPEVIGENESGILLYPRMPEPFAEAINFFIENPEEARRRGQLGRQRVEKLFNVFCSIHRIQLIYAEGLKNIW